MARLGIPRERIRTFPSGIDIEAFHPRFRDPDLWQRLARAGAPEIPSWAVKALYCGRVSVEKNTPLLERIWPEVRARCEARNIEAHLVVVGDGPDRDRLTHALRRQRVSFLGFRHAEELSRIYASCDLFVFPSLTDTLGQVVMEAQASGLAAVVGDRGGPATIVRDGQTGRIAAASDDGAWIDAVTGLLCDARTRAAMGRAARSMMATRGFGASFDAFWQAHEGAYREHLVALGVREAVRTNGRTSRRQEASQPS